MANFQQAVALTGGTFSPWVINMLTRDLILCVSILILGKSTNRAGKLASERCPPSCAGKFTTSPVGRRKSANGYAVVAPHTSNAELLLKRQM